MNLEQITEIEIIDLICHSDRKDKADTIIYMSSLYHYYHYEIKMAKTNEDHKAKVNWVGQQIRIFLDTGYKMEETKKYIPKNEKK